MIELGFERIVVVLVGVLSIIISTSISINIFFVKKEIKRVSEFLNVKLLDIIADIASLKTTTSILQQKEAQDKHDDRKI